MKIIPFFSLQYNYKHEHQFGHFKHNLKKENFMANSQELFEQIKDLFVQFESEHNGTSKAKSRTKKKLVKLKNL